MSDNSGSNFAVGFLAGAVVGGIIALLFAPRTGKETRALIRESAIEVKERALDVADTVRFETEEAAERAKAAVAGAKQTVSDVTKKAQVKVDAFKSA